MSSFVLYSRASSVTGPKVANYLGIPSGTEIPRRHRRCDHLIRWGNSYESSRGAQNILNSGNAISNAVDKLSSLRTLSQAGVPVPYFNESPTDLDSDIIIGRETEHSGGTDISFYEGRRHVSSRDHDYFLEYIEAGKEFRVHVVNGDIIKVSQKVYRGDGPEPQDPIIRNFDNGYRFIRPQSRPAGLVQAVAAVQALELDFGAVDILFDQRENPYVLEVNTAPSADPPTLEAYGQEFLSWADISNPPGLDNVEYDDE